MTFVQDRSQNPDPPATTLHLLERQCHLEIDVKQQCNVTCYQILGKLVLCCSFVLNVVYDTVPKAEGQRYCKMIR